MLLSLDVFVFFFRDPEREIHDDPNDRHAVVSPADGRVVHSGPAQSRVGPKGVWSQVSVFLSPLDVHVNRTPVSGRVIDIRYKAGRFLPAYRSDAAANNERNEIWFDHEGQIVVCRQIVGLLARRVVCRLVPGVQVTQGQRLGIMKFGSRMDVFLPPDSTLEVTSGQTVRGGETIIARLTVPNTLGRGED